MKNVDKTFWVTNISNRSASLPDLNVRIKPMSSVNLLSNNHHLTEEQLEKSYASGDLFLKKNQVVKRLVPPIGIKGNKIEVDSNATIPSKPRSILEIKIEEYEELKVSEDKEEALQQEFDSVAETADSAESDRQPLIPKGKG